MKTLIIAIATALAFTSCTQSTSSKHLTENFDQAAANRGDILVRVAYRPDLGDKAYTFAKFMPLGTRVGDTCKIGNRTATVVKLVGYNR